MGDDTEGARHAAGSVLVAVLLVAAKDNHVARLGLVFFAGEVQRKAGGLYEKLLPNADGVGDAD